MTYDEIMALEVGDLGAAVAERVMGWPIFETHAEARERGCEDVAYVIRHMGTLHLYDPEEGQPVWFDPDHDMRAAWVVAERLHEMGYDVGVNLVHDWADKVECVLDGRTDAERAREEWYAVASGPTAPIAICRAALVLVEKEGA